MNGCMELPIVCSNVFRGHLRRILKLLRVLEPLRVNDFTIAWFDTCDVEDNTPMTNDSNLFARCPGLLTMGQFVHELLQGQTSF